MTSALPIDVVSDVVCPWCYIGATRLEQALSELGPSLEAELCYHPFELDPSMPATGELLADKLRRKYGVDPRTLWGRVESAARDSGLALDLSRQTMAYPTTAAHTLLRHAHPRGTQRGLMFALFRAYFDDALDIADPEVLASLATGYGFAHEEAVQLVTSAVELDLTREQARSATSGGIRGVPFFILGGRVAVSGAQTVSVLKAAIHEALSLQTPSELPSAS